MPLKGKNISNHQIPLIYTHKTINNQRKKFPNKSYNVAKEKSCLISNEGDLLGFIGKNFGFLLIKSFITETPPIFKLTRCRTTTTATLFRILHPPNTKSYIDTYIHLEFVIANFLVIKKWFNFSLPFVVINRMNTNESESRQCLVWSLKGFSCFFIF